MFWESVVAGIGRFFEWQILVGATCLSLSTLLYWALGAIILNNAGNLRIGPGCLLTFMFLGGPLIQMIGVTCFIFACLPAIIGEGGFTPAVAIGQMMWPVIKLGVWAGVLVILLSLIPFIGGVVAKTPGVPVFLQGIFMLEQLCKRIYYGLTATKLPDSVFPSFWANVGYVIVAILLLYITYMIFSLPIVVVKDYVKKRRDPVGHLFDRYAPLDTRPTAGDQLIGGMIGPLVGILPLLMYGRYVYASIRALNDLPILS